MAWPTTVHPFAQAFDVEYKTAPFVSAVTKPQNIFCASANGKLYRQNGLDLEEITHGPELSADKPLQAVSHLQKLFIADYGEGRKPKVYDPAIPSLTEWEASDGTLPLGCPLIARYRDRLVLAGAADAAHRWYMSHQGDSDDWEYGFGLGIPGLAVSGQVSDAGDIGEPINALIPHSDDFLVFGCQDSIWVLRGDAGYGGFIVNISREIGIIGPNAWCRGPSGEIIFLSRDGLYGLDAGAQTYPISISREKLPNELVDINTAAYDVLLAYDVRFRGVHIYLSGRSISGAMHYWFDWETQGLWPVRLQDGHEPTAIFAYHSDVAADSTVLLGGRDGYIRQYVDGFGDDDGRAFDSYTLLGPFRLSGNDHRAGLLTELIGAPADGSGSVVWAMQVGDTQEAAFLADPTASGTWNGGLNYTVRPRLRGNSMFLRLSGQGLTPWVMERVTAVRMPVGTLKKL
jgi:hypothetical protein